MVIMSAFQAEDGGSIPLTRSLKNRPQACFLYIKYKSPN